MRHPQHEPVIPGNDDGEGSGVAIQVCGDEFAVAEFGEGFWQMVEAVIETLARQLSDEVPLIFSGVHVDLLVTQVLH